MMTPDQAAVELKSRLKQLEYYGDGSWEMFDLGAVRALLAGYEAALNEINSMVYAPWGEINKCKYCANESNRLVCGSSNSICTFKWRGLCADNSPEPGGEG